MVQVFPGRFTAEVSGPFVVFAIGMRLNRLYAIHKWFKPAIDTFRMVRLLGRKPPKGYLGGQLVYYWRGIGMLQYWKTFGHLEEFAKDRSLPHADAWGNLLRQTQTDQTFGYWHETYQIEEGRYECIYGSMPKFGLAQAASHVALTESRDSARGRLQDKEIAELH
jgi:hypothetical protein